MTYLSCDSHDRVRSFGYKLWEDGYISREEVDHSEVFNSIFVCVDPSCRVNSFGECLLQKLKLSKSLLKRCGSVVNRLQSSLVQPQGVGFRTFQLWPFSGTELVFHLELEASPKMVCAAHEQRSFALKANGLGVSVTAVQGCCI